MFYWIKQTHRLVYFIFNFIRLDQPRGMDKKMDFIKMSISLYCMSQFEQLLHKLHQNFGPQVLQRMKFEKKNFIRDYVYMPFFHHIVVQKMVKKNGQKQTKKKIIIFAKQQKKTQNIFFFCHLYFFSLLFIFLFFGYYNIYIYQFVYTILLYIKFGVFFNICFFSLFYMTQTLKIYMMQKKCTCI